MEAVEHGRVVGSGQFAAGGTKVPGINRKPVGAAKVSKSGKEVVVTGKGFRYVSDKSGGRAYTYKTLLYPLPATDVNTPSPAK
ncbi:hypothetical protein GCM10009735_40180 [Actinomadura chokoriensis]